MYFSRKATRVGPPDARPRAGGGGRGVCLRQKGLRGTCAPLWEEEARQHAAAGRVGGQGP